MSDGMELRGIATDTAKTLGSTQHKVAAGDQAQVKEPQKAEQNAAPETKALLLPPEKMREVGEALAKALELLNESLQIEFDDSTDRFILRVVNRETHEVIRQVPPEDFIAIVRKLRDYVGLLLDIEI